MSSSVSSSNSSVAGTSKIYSYSSSGLSGLVSGMDTETMVKKMLQGTQKKIDTQKQKQQILTWQQTMYRSAISKINALKSKYFDASYGSSLTTNLSSSKFFNAKIAKVTSGDSVTVATADSSADVGDMTFKVGQLATATKLTGNSMSKSQGITGTNIDFSTLKTQLAAGDVAFDISLDGVTKTITLQNSDFTNGTVDATALQSALTTKVEKAFGTYVTPTVTTDESGNSKLSLTVNIKKDDGTTESGHELVVTGYSSTYLGITPGATSLVSSMATLGSLSGVSGGTYSFSINGTNFAFSSSDTIGTMISKINKSDAGVNISYSSSTNSFTMQASSTGSQYGIEIQQYNGTLLTALFGADKIGNGTSVSGAALNTNSVVGNNLTQSGYTTTGASLAMTVNGTSYTFSLETKSSGTYSAADIEKDLNAWLNDKFGSTNGTQNISYKDGTFTTAAGYQLSFAKTGVASTDSTASSNLAVAMGFAKNGASNAVTGDTAISSIPGLSGMTFYKEDGMTEATTLSEIKYLKDTDTDGNPVNHSASFSATVGAIQLAGAEKDTVTLNDSAVAAYFGVSSYTFGTGKATAASITAGKDLKISINGTETSRSSNTFMVDGLTITATKVDTSATSTTVSTTRDTDSIVNTVKSFVSDYNALVSELYGKITEDYTCKDYKPLTDAQKDEMSDSAITAWEKKAQTGLLRSDSTISSFLQSMRNAFYTKVDSAGIAAYSIGIETTQDDLSGKLTLDESAFRNAIASDPDAVSKLFTDSTSGLSIMLAKAMDGAAKLSAASPGSLVQLAGADGWTANAKTNDIYKELLSINDKLSDLQDKYDDEKTRYWNKFNSMEAAIAKYQSQSSMISSSFSS